MENNIPIYRAKKIESEEYIIGLLSEAVAISSTNKDLKPLVRLWVWNKDGRYEIDPSTLAIHYKGMNDSDGKKIFASLDDDKGIGGDIVYIAGKGNCYIISDINGVQALIIDNNANITDDIFLISESYMENDVGKIIGIQR